MCTSFTSASEFPVISNLPKFYQEVVLAFNSVKSVKPVKCISDYEMMTQPIHGNILFKWKDKCLYLKSFLKSNILYVKDLINENGVLKSEQEMYNSITFKATALNDMFILKNTVMKMLMKFDVRVAVHINKMPSVHILTGNVIHVINDQKSKFFYVILKNKQCTRPDMETVWSNKFSFENKKAIWSNVYHQKIEAIKDNKLSEFNFKVIHNILPCGYILSKWNYNVKERCDVCNEIETVQHMLYDCNRIKDIWINVSNIMKIEVKWKHLICGFITEDVTDKVIFYNTIFTVIMYAIFKCNNTCKYENKSYNNENIRSVVKRNLCFHKNVMVRYKKIKVHDWKDTMFENTIACM